jgi:hypothetical protein
MAKKLHTDGNLLHHDHQHPFQPNAHTQKDPSLSSGSFPTQPNRTITGKQNFLKKKQIKFLFFI